MNRATLSVILIFCYFGYVFASSQKPASALPLLVSASANQGGLWITGDAIEGLARLRWIAGEPADLISLNYEGKVHLNERLLPRKHHIQSYSAFQEESEAVSLRANEGLLLIAQLARSHYHYCLHVGHSAPTSGGEIAVNGFINLERNFDSRINPRRPNGRKLNQELPPEGYDALVGINPDARLFNFCTGEFVPEGLIVFHELAEAYAKLELELEYLGRDSRPGAHDVALTRERILSSERPQFRGATTAGMNLLLQTESEIRKFYLSRAFIEGRKRHCRDSTAAQAGQ